MPFPTPGPRRRTACLALSGLLAAAAAVGAFEVRFEGDGTPLDPGQIQALHTELKRVIRAHEAVFHRTLPTEFTIVYRISRTRPDYEERAETAGHSVRGLAGFTQVRQRWQTAPDRRLLSAESIIETWRDQPATSFMAVLMHESTHAVTGGFVGAIPLWFKEGTAELLGTPAAGRFHLKRQEEATRWATLARRLDQGRLPPLKPFLEADSYAAWDRLFGGDRSAAYTASYTLFFLLCAQPGALSFMSAWLDAPHPDQPDTTGQAFADHLARHWPGGLTAWERSWHALIRSKAASAHPNPATPSP